MKSQYALSSPRNIVVAGLLAVIISFFGSTVFMPAAHAELSVNSAPARNTTDPFPDEETIQIAFNRYLIVSLDGSKQFDTERAVTDNVDPRIIEIGEQANFLMSDQASSESDRQLRDLNPANYGRWCGKNNSGPGNPINSLDRACMGHDHCLNIKRPVCDCDREFVNRLRQIKNQYSGWPRTYLEAAIVVVPKWHGCRV